VIGPIANGLSFVRNFVGPCLWVLLAGFIAGGTSGGWLAWKLQDGRVARAETALAQFEKKIATATAATEILARQRQQEADAALRQRDQEVTAAVDAIPAEVAKLVAPQFAALRSQINAPIYDCIRTVPLPEPYLDGLRRPGGTVADH